MRDEALPVEPEPRAFPLVLAGPSGSGKTTVGRALVRRRADVRFSISATTRPPREGESEGRDYHFLDEPTFREWVDRGEMLEWARVHGHLYGTPLGNLEEARASGRHLLLDIDVQGARSVRAVVPEAVSVFLLPPSGEAVVERLLGRGTERAEERRRRLEAAIEELGAVGEFDYVIVNAELGATVELVGSILDAECHRIDRMGEGVEEARERLTREIESALASETAERDPREERATT